GDEPERRSDAGRHRGDGAGLLEGARPAAVGGLLVQALADVAVERVRRVHVRAQHRRLVALVQPDRMEADDAFAEVRLHLGVLLGRELPVHVGVEEGLFQLPALVRQARLLNSSNSATSSSSTVAEISIACLPCTTPLATAYPSRFFCSNLRPR